MWIKSNKHYVFLVDGLTGDKTYVMFSKKYFMTIELTKQTKLQNDLETFSEIVDESLRKTIITDNLASDGNGLIYGADLDLKRISSGTIKSISIKNPGGSSESAQGNHYLALQFFKEGDPDTTNEYKSLEETYFSKEPVNLTTSSDYNFDFDGVNVPHDIKFVRLMLTTSNTGVPNPRDTNTVSLMRVGLTNYNKESEEKLNNEIIHNIIFYYTYYSRKNQLYRQMFTI